jgi:hypothetical protein
MLYFWSHVPPPSADANPSGIIISCCLSAVEYTGAISISLLDGVCLRPGSCIWIAAAFDWGESRKFQLKASQIIWNGQTSESQSTMVSEPFILARTLRVCSKVCHRRSVSRKPAGLRLSRSCRCGRWGRRTWRTSSSCGRTRRRTDPPAQTQMRRCLQKRWAMGVQASEASEPTGLNNTSDEAVYNGVRFAEARSTAGERDDERHLKSRSIPVLSRGGTLNNIPVIRKSVNDWNASQRMTKGTMGPNLATLGGMDSLHNQWNGPENQLFNDPG